MARILSLTLLPVLGLVALMYLFPDTTPARKVEKIVEHVTRVIASDANSQSSGFTSSTNPVSYENLAPASFTVGPEQANQLEVRIWAIKNDTNYGWIQLPRGTIVQFLRQDGDYIILRYQETVIRAHRSIVEAGLVVPRKMRTYAVAY